MSIAIEAPARASTPSSAVSRPVLASIVVVAVGLIAGVTPVAWHFARDLYARGEYTCFLMVPITAAVLMRRPLGVAGLRRGSWWIAGPLIAAGALIYLRWSAAPAIALLLAGVAYRTGGTTMLRWGAPVPVLLLVSTPLPSIVANSVLLWLRGVAVAGSGHVFDVLGLPNAQTGTVLEIPGRRLLVEEACSGINSLTAIIAFALLYAYVLRHSAARLLAIAIAAAGFALLANVARIVAIGVALVWFGIDLLDPTLHQWLGLLTFTLAVGLVISADQLTLLLAPPRPPRAHATSSGSAAGSPVAIGNAWLVVAVAFLAVGVWSGHRLWGGWPASTLRGDAVFLAPKVVGTWTLTTGAGNEPHEIQSLNVQNYAWTYRDGTRRAEVSFTYPFAHGIHDCTSCYVLSGWTLENESIDPALGGTTVDLARPGPTVGRLLFATFDEHGTWQPPTPLPTGPWLAARIAYEGDVANQLPSYEMQVLGIDASPIGAPTRDALRTLFVTVRDDLRRQMLAQRSIAAAEPRP